MSAKQYVDLPDLTVYHEELMEYLAQQGMSDAIILQGVLTSGSNSITFTNSNITSSSRFDIYASQKIYKTSAVVSGNTLTITFDSAASGDVLVTVIVNWDRGTVDPTYFGGLYDVNITNPLDGQVPRYNAQTSKWENGDASVVGDLNDLDDVDINSPQAEGDVLVSDENGVYQNQPKSLYPSAPTMTWAEYQQLVDDEEDDPDAEYYIDDVDVAEAYYVETSGQTALTGATSLTFTNSHITPTSDIRILAEPASCKVSGSTQYKVSAKVSSVSSGSATISFPALAENTEFWLLINCPLVSISNPLSEYIVFASETGTTSSNGTFNTTLSITKPILSVYTPSADSTAGAYTCVPERPASSSSSTNWRVHVRKGTANNDVVANTQITIEYWYIDI